MKMCKNKGYWPLWLFFLNQLSYVFGYSVNQNPFRHFVTLDSEGKYNLEWLVDWDRASITYNVTVASTGYVAFGFAKNRVNLNGADLFIGGISGGFPYFNDYFFSNITSLGPQIDPTKNDWVLNGAEENGTHTFLSFTRSLDTCDKPYDLAVTDDLQNVIYAYGSMDNESPKNQLENFGRYSVYLLDPDFSPDLEKLRRLEDAGAKMNISRFPMTATIPLPSVDTMYWCHFFRSPEKTKHHIIGFNTILETEKDRKHVHHLLVHRCRATPGRTPEELFEFATRTQGTECFFQNAPHPLPTQECQEVIHLWGVGGRSIFFPENAGMRMSEDGTEYFMIQVHYDNPQIESGDVTFSVEAYYTDNLRENEVGMIPLGELTPAATSIMIPPNSSKHVILGHCPSECLQKMLPAHGVNVFAGFLHTHLLGNGVRFRHFRGNKELPWIANADNYDFNYQQFRSLIEERKILPGDQLGMVCSYNTTPRLGATICGGHSTRDEMCTGHLYYYSDQPIEFAFCRSELRTEEYMNRLGIRNTTWDPSRRQMMITDPPEYAGLTVYEYANRYINWTPELREQIQRDHRLQPQIAQCPIVDDTPPLPAEWEANSVLAWNPILRGVPLYQKPATCRRRNVLLSIPSWGKHIENSLGHWNNH